MGIFSTRPEEPTEWAGLPSEPERIRSGAEALPEPIDSADSLGLLGTSIASVAIPLPPADATVGTGDGSSAGPSSDGV